MRNVPYLWKNKRWPFHFPSHLLELIRSMTFFSNIAHWSISWWKLHPVLFLFPPYNLPWSKLLCKYQSSHIIFHCLHVLNTLLIFFITLWPEITTVIHNIQHSRPTPLLETNKIHQNRNISDNTIVAIAVTIRKYLLWLKYLQQNILKTTLWRKNEFSLNILVIHYPMENFKRKDPQTTQTAFF